MKVLDTIYLHPDKNCTTCLGRGWVLFVHPNLVADKYREARPCPRCVKQVVKIEEDGQWETT